MRSRYKSPWTAYPVRFHSFVLRDSDGGETSYLQLRDVADTLSGTEAQFNVGWDRRDRVITLTPGAAYTDRTGSEMTAPFSGDQTCRPGTSAVKLDGEPRASGYHHADRRSG